MSEGYESDAVKLIDAIKWRYDRALSRATLSQATANGRRWATTEDVLEAARVVAESAPTYIDGA